MKRRLHFLIPYKHKFKISFQCNRAQWVHHYSTPCLPDNRSCSDIGQCLSGPHPKATNCHWATVSGPAQPLGGASVSPAHKQPMVKKGLLVKGFWTAVEWWLWGGEWGKRWIPAQPSPWGPPAHLAWASRWVGPQRTGLGCSGLLQSSEPSSRSPTSLGPGLEATVNLFPHPCVCDLTAVAVCLGYILWGLVSPLSGLRSLRANWVGHLAPSVMTAGHGVGI